MMKHFNGFYFTINVIFIKVLMKPWKLILYILLLCKIKLNSYVRKKSMQKQLNGYLLLIIDNISYNNTLNEEN